jgi:hypothetical protein
MIVDYKPQEVHQIVEKSGGSQAELIATAPSNRELRIEDL